SNNVREYTVPSMMGNGKLRPQQSSQEQKGGGRGSERSAAPCVCSGAGRNACRRKLISRTRRRGPVVRDTQGAVQMTVRQRPAGPAREKFERPTLERARRPFGRLPGRARRPSARDGCRRAGLPNGNAPPGC